MLSGSFLLNGLKAFVHIFLCRRGRKMSLADEGECCNSSYGCPERWDFANGTYGPECSSRCSFRPSGFLVRPEGLFVPDTPQSSRSNSPAFGSVVHDESRSVMQSPLPPSAGLIKPVASMVTPYFRRSFASPFLN